MSRILAKLVRIAPFLALAGLAFAGSAQPPALNVEPMENVLISGFMIR